MLIQSPHDPAFVQDPYPFYDRARDEGPVHYWQDYGMHAAFDHATVHALLRDKQLGRAVPGRGAAAPHLADFDAVERYSLLELEPPEHTRLRRLVLHAFTSRRIAGLEGDIRDICAELIAGLPEGPFDLIPTYCQLVPVRVIARLLGVPEEMGPDLLRWSAAMVAMYQAGRDRAIEDAANAAAGEFSAFLRGYIEERRGDPRDDLITELIAAEDGGETLSREEMIGTCVLLLNAGHEATVHSLGNAVKALVEHGAQEALAHPERCIEEVLRYDPPLHMFTRHVYEPIDVGGHSLGPGDEIALMLGAAGRDPAAFDRPDRFDPARVKNPHVAFGGGLHFCVGAPLARLEMQIALPMLFDAMPDLRIAETPEYADSYHFHKLDRLIVSAT
ncbi:cytochrome P450 [Tateyamaria omphalii]|uniref:Cytochrome n=1 Tax=Tateyamaria omphalii TaxID=299262 RepID=A0A1P8MT40_9RHOB|nr:cytochrome P450 [Tateyamaria omphalii]APX11215.1 cytochrome [Tateyamaria omphalii]